MCIRDSYTRLLEMMQEAEAGKRPRYVCDGERFFHAERVLTTPAYSADVKISDGGDTVSYTHLDVYKRQASPCAPMSCITASAPLRSTRPFS